MHTMMITLYTTTELETLSDAELDAYKTQLTQLARLTSTWEVETEQWVRACPQRSAKRAETNARVEAESAARIAAEIAAIDAAWDAEQARIDMESWHMVRSLERAA